MRFIEWALVALICGFFGLIGVRIGQKTCDAVEQVEWKKVGEGAADVAQKTKKVATSATAKAKAKAKAIHLRPRKADGTLPKESWRKILREEMKTK